MTLAVAASLLVDGQPTLFSGPGRVGRLGIVNNLDGPIALAAREGPAGPDNFHVALHLPKGSLSAASLAALAVTDGGWLLRVGETSRGENRWDSLYFLQPAGQTVAASSELVILIHGLAAEPAGAPRHTRAVVQYDLSSVSSPEPVRGSRTVRTYVVPWPHHPADLHLHIGVRDGDAVINRDEIANRIVVALTSTAVDGEVVLAAGATRLELSWDVGPPESIWWGLCTAGQAEDVEVLVDWSGGVGQRLVDPRLDTQAWVSETGAIWSIVVPETRTIGYGESIHIELTNLVTDHPAGPTNLAVKVLGANDGAFGHVTVPVHKQGHRPAPPGPQMRIEQFDAAQADLDTTVATADWAAVLCSASLPELRLVEAGTTWRIRHPRPDAPDVFAPIRNLIEGDPLNRRWQASVLFIRKELLR